MKPKYAPINVRGTEIQNQRANMATRVPKGMAAEEPSPHRMRFITKKSANTTLCRDSRHVRPRVRDTFCPLAYLIKHHQSHPGQRKAVSKTLVFHFSPPKATY